MSMVNQVVCVKPSSRRKNYIGKYGLCTNDNTEALLTDPIVVSFYNGRTPDSRAFKKSELQVVTKMACVHCGADVLEWKMYANGLELLYRKECFTCNHFMSLARMKDRSSCIVLRRNDLPDAPLCHYMIGDEDCPTILKGFGGHKWTFKMLDTREVITTTNLWHQGHIPEHLQKYFKENAVQV